MMSKQTRLRLDVLKREGTADGLECRICGYDRRVGTVSHKCAACADSEVRKITDGKLTLRHLNSMTPEQLREFTNPQHASTIQTVAGTAHYVRTETEDAGGRWNDSYAARDGYYVVHKGPFHHVYRVGESGRVRE